MTRNFLIALLILVIAAASSARAQQTSAGRVADGGEAWQGGIPLF